MCSGPAQREKRELSVPSVGDDRNPTDNADLENGNLFGCLKLASEGEGCHSKRIANRPAQGLHWGIKRPSDTAVVDGNSVAGDIIDFNPKFSLHLLSINLQHCVQTVFQKRQQDANLAEGIQHFQ